ncbi:hypothetical protein ONZ45_g1914 [Pleurotus djamor]|nr:hypothetical protein ONZ45_g1914 [Pleurotus djamor]
MPFPSTPRATRKRADGVSLKLLDTGLSSLPTKAIGDHAPETDILNHCPYVRHLDLDIRSRLQGLRVFEGPPSTVNLPGLQTLNLRFLYPETYTLYTPKLQALSFRIFFSTSRELDTATWSLIPRVPLSVTKLTLEFVVDTPQSSSDESPSFGDYTNNVEHLTLIAKLDPIARTHGRVLGAIDSLLSTAYQKNLLGLRTISLKFHIPCDFDIALQNLRPNAAWASLDTHLNALLCSGRLESLFFDLQFSDRLGDPLFKSQRDRSRKMSEFMEDCLPHISRSGIISVKVVESF